MIVVNDPEILKHWPDTGVDGVPEGYALAGRRAK